uniref:SPOR domain-containing protein n=1 Tax=Roseihalotalea indica TaxID=2867963 RepID=A0AA49JH36_9BACT|nr:SPOR domain-containing protein [Tunicatimonas sp. TK19036]
MKRIATIFFYLASAAFLFQHCAPTKTISTQGNETYEEDISQYRIQYADSLARPSSSEEGDNDVELNPERQLAVASSLNTPNAVTEEMDEYFSEVDNINREKNEYQGFTLQVYTGDSREQANEAKLKVYEALPDADPKIQFNTVYRVRVGEYASRLEAQQDYSALKEVFPNVLPIPATFRAVE